MDSFIIQLLLGCHNIFQDLDKGYEVHGTFLDISNTFGKVWYKDLHHELNQNKIRRTLLKISIDFLKL